MATATAAAANTMPDDDRYLFDLNGFVVVRGVFGAEEIAAASDYLDELQARERQQDHERTGRLRNTSLQTPLAGDGASGRVDFGGTAIFKAPGDAGAMFRSVLDHPRLVPYYHSLLGGEGFRMDHQPLCITQRRGSEGFHLHGGTVDSRTGRYNPHLAYHYGQDGSMHNSLLAVAVQLCDHNAGDGGFCVVRGSHKSNMAMPESMVHGLAFTEHLYQPETRAGDVVLFSEGTVHGALPWTAEHQRKVALYRFAPATMAYSRSYLTEWGQEGEEEEEELFTEAQRAVLQPPFTVRADRAVIDPEGGGSVATRSRDEYKKVFDRKVFGSDYF